MSVRTERFIVLWMVTNNTGDVRFFATEEDARAYMMHTDGPCCLRRVGVTPDEEV